MLNRDRSSFGDNPETNLPSARQLDIDLGKQLCVQQRAMLHTMTTVDPEAHAQGIEAVLGTGMPGPRQLKRVDHSMHGHRRPAAFLQLAIQKAEVEAGIVRDQRRVFEEVEKRLGRLGKARLVGQKQV